MRYQCPPDKDEKNLRKHGLRLADGIPALEDPDAVVRIDNRFDDGEERWITLGKGRQGILYVVSVDLDEDLTRIISVRKAEPHEQRRYARGDD
jgi:uncharacterized DUF497 family protein